MKDLHEYLDKKQIEMETEHIKFSAAGLMEEAGVPQPSGAKTTKITPRRPRLNKPGPKSSKKKGGSESSDEEMDIDNESDGEDNASHKKVNGSVDYDDEDLEEKAATKKRKASIEEDESDTSGPTIRVDVHA